MNQLIVRKLGRQEYSPCWLAMQNFTNQRQDETPDELWLLEHPPIFTLGQNGKPEHILNAGEIPLLKIDRGGQVTYHGPGQLMAYTLINIKAKQLSIRRFVCVLEQTVIDLLAAYQIEGKAKSEAPGVYVGDQKIASIGLRIRRGCAFHGLALNVAMDLAPFSRINPCGYSGLEMTQISQLGGPSSVEDLGLQLAKGLAKNLGYAELLLLESKAIPAELL